MSKEIYKLDLKRYAIQGKSHATRYLYWLRLNQQTKCRFMELLSKAILVYYRTKYGLEITNGKNIGPGLYLRHAWNITINPASIIGSNCNIHRGALIGQTNRGFQVGTPTIGNEVWIGINAAIVGNITIGNDVFIAPNSYVNVDVPSHSIVFGNPCIIKHRDHATGMYINHKCPIE